MQLSYLVDQLVGALPKWKATKMPKSGRLLLLQSVLCAMPLHAMLALNLPKKTIAALNKICRGFLWSADTTAHGGSCVVACERVCSPKWAGGLGIPNLQWLNIALQVRWPWLQKFDKERPWAEFQIHVPNVARQLVHSAVRPVVGNGQSIMLWEDRWLDGTVSLILLPTSMPACGPEQGKPGRLPGHFTRMLGRGTWTLR